MLNISPNSIAGRLDPSEHRSFRMLAGRSSKKLLMRLLLVFLGIFLVVLFLPWTQNIRTRGRVTTLYPQERPQKVQSVIQGQITEWHVRQGTPVETGDTILTLREVRNDYFSPKVLERLKDRIVAQKEAKKALKQKATALADKIDALEQERELKQRQIRNRIEQNRLRFQSDSMEAIAADIRYEISKEQFKRNKDLQESGIRSKTEMENQNLKMQEGKAKKAASKNQMLASKNAWFNAKMEQERVLASYGSKLAKVRSDRSDALSKVSEMEAKITDLKNRLANLRIRRTRHAVTAPQGGVVNRTIQGGVGETVKKGESVAEILPEDPRLAVEMDLKPMNLPLVEEGQHVRIQFDGWPAVVFSGWPNVSYGTFGGEVVAVNQVPDKKGHYNVLIRPGGEGKDWPDELGIGGGTDNMILLDEVPVWYEIWRRINGFPPNYYKGAAPSVDQVGKTGH